MTAADETGVGKIVTAAAETTWEVFASKVVLRVTEPGALDRARAAAEHELDAIDRACSRFRDDSEISYVNANAGRAVQVSPLLMEALALGLRAAEITEGDVDPTIGAALVLAGYDRDWRLLDAPGKECPPVAPGKSTCPEAPRKSTPPGMPGNGTPPRMPAKSAPPVAPGNGTPPRMPGESTPPGAPGESTPPRMPGESTPPGAPGESTPPRMPGKPVATGVRVMGGWRRVVLDHERGTVRLPAGALLDLGATAKAWAADRAAAAAADAGACGALVAIGGDVAVSGPAPTGGWSIRVTDDHRSDPRAPGQTVTIVSGGLATSSTSVRRWRHGGRTLHHLFDPATGEPATGPWRTVSAAAASCADANIATTAAIVRGERALAWLRTVGLPARLVKTDGRVHTVSGWPKPRLAARRASSRRMVSRAMAVQAMAAHAIAARASSAQAQEALR